MPVVKGDRFSKDQCPKNDFERGSVKDVPYSSVVGNLMYAQVCTKPGIIFSVSVLGRCLSNLRREYWVAIKKVVRYLQQTKGDILIYRRVDDRLKLYNVFSPKME